MQDFSVRVQNLVEDLAALQHDLNQRLMTGAVDDGASPQLGESADAESIRNLKCAVDQLRHFLWFYLQALSSGSEAGEKTMQLLRQVAKNGRSLSGASSLTFLERINALAEYALVHYNSGDAKRPN